MIEDSLRDTLGSDWFRNRYWRKDFLHQPKAFDPGELPSTETMWELIAAGLLTPPYIVAVSEGRRSEGGDLVEPLRTAGHETTTFISAARLRSAFDTGSTVKFNQLDDWSPRLRTLASIIAEATDSTSEAFAFLSPPGRRALRAHTDGTHVLVLQVEGRKHWQIASIDSTSSSGEGLYRDGTIPADEVIELELEPGDLLYMPHGTPHQALAQSGHSLHFAITIEEPSPLTYLDGLMKEFSASAGWRELSADWLQLPRHESDAMADELLRKFVNERRRLL